MRTAKRDIVYTEHSRFNKPSMVVTQGEIFQVETELCTGKWLQSVDDIYNKTKIECVNPTVCIAIKDTKPGDVVVVNIIDVRVDNIGYTGFDAGENPLANMIDNNQWNLTTKTVRIEDGHVLWSEKLKIPINPMIGTLGTAPKTAINNNAIADINGGNMDVQEVRAGSKVYLPVFVEGALLHIGDVHAIQGDGEINLGGGLECRSIVTLSIEIIKKPKSYNCVRIQDDEYIMAVGCKEDVMKSFYMASGEILRWMVESYGFTRDEAYLLMGLVMQARCSQFVNPTRTYICKMPKKYLLP